MKKASTNYAAFANADLITLSVALAFLFGFCTAKQSPIFAPQQRAIEYGLERTADSLILSLEANMGAWDSQFNQEYMVAARSLKNNRPAMVIDAVLDTNFVKRK
jgi:hypothetical protein